MLERGGSGGKAERQGCPKGRGEVLAGPFTVSERSERRQKLSVALTPAGPVHHLEDSQPHRREETLRTFRVISGRASWAPLLIIAVGESVREQVVTGGRGPGTRVGSSPPNGIREALAPPGGRVPRPGAGTEIFRWSDRRERAEGLLRPRRSLVTLPATKPTEIVEQGRSRERKSSLGSRRSADLVSKALAALRPGRSAGERTGTDGGLTKGTGARSDAMSAHVARNVRRHVKSSIGGPMGCADFL